MFCTSHAKKTLFGVRKAIGVFSNSRSEAPSSAMSPRASGRLRVVFSSSRSETGDVTLGFLAVDPIWRIWMTLRVQSRLICPCGFPILFQLHLQVLSEKCLTQVGSNSYCGHLKLHCCWHVFRWCLFIFSRGVAAKSRVFGVSDSNHDFNLWDPSRIRFNGPGWFPRTSGHKVGGVSLWCIKETCGWHLKSEVLWGVAFTSPPSYRLIGGRAI